MDIGPALFGFFVSFMLVPFAAAGYWFMAFLLLWETLGHLWATDPISYPFRIFVILCTVFGRFIGELAWRWILTR